ncbi:DUF6603 domain-containing protein [Rhodococcus sp. NCIMB 12038]|uniref:DUF6603 domain-containing protein n=1 Tax=Rhodococcus sp. NCIMB 12038 TaxID=933800 RepID=UPI000B3D0902|nr:DUF6603 domain-containing protein [Rhodococcus sp. NCIMB 12038]OUS97411.1 hypothetical protein CA951_03455 [Rhodococcus sp. NCIMB 12038]
MTDIATGFIRGIEAFLITRLGVMTQGAWRNTGALVGSVATFDKKGRQSAYDKLKADIDSMSPIVKAIAEKIGKQTEVIAKMVTEAAKDVKDDDFNFDVAARVAVRVGTALAAADEAYRIIASELAKDSTGKVDENLRNQLLDLWNPWALAFTNMGTTSSNALNQFGKLFGVKNLTDKLGDHLELDRSEGFHLVAKIAKSGSTELGDLTLDQLSFEAFLQFSDRQIANPTDEEKKSLIQRDNKFYSGDIAILGLRVRTLLEPGITKDKLLKKVMPGAKDPTTTTLTAISLDTAQGLYLGDGRAQERAVLPVRVQYPGLEFRELAIGLVRNRQREIIALEVTTSIATEIEDVVGMQIVGSGVVITPEGPTEHQAMFSLPVSPRWPDGIGLKINAGPVSGAGYIERIERKYKVGNDEVKRIEFGGVIQLKVLTFGVNAIVVLSPDPFSLILILGTRFPVAIELGFGFTLNGIGGILALERGFSVPALQEALKDHIVERMLMPDDPSIDGAPKLLEQVAQIFPPRSGGFVVGPAVELGWGSQAKFVTLKLAVVLALPDPSVTLLGSVRIQAPTKEGAITDIRADMLATVNADHLRAFARMRDSKMGPLKISGDMGMYVEWGGEGAFELSVGGFHPAYWRLTGKEPHLLGMQPATVELSPIKLVTIVATEYFAVTPGTVQFGVEGTFTADFKVITASAWIGLNAIFTWSPYFAFQAGFRVGAKVELLGQSIADVGFSGTLSGAQPFQLSGHIKVDVWFLPTFDKDVGPISWGDPPSVAPPPVDALALVATELRRPESWKAILPPHADQLAALADVESAEVDGQLAHPLAGLEVVQNAVPLGIKIDRIGTSPVTADMVTLGTPTMSQSEAAAVSELRSAFAPGHFFALEGEKLLAQSGFEEFQSGIRIAASTTPVIGAEAPVTVSYRIYLRGSGNTAAEADWTSTTIPFDTAHVSSSLTARAVRENSNPYLTTRLGRPPVIVAPLGTSVLTDPATGTRLLDGLGALTATAADVVREAVRGSAAAVRMEVRKPV